MLLLILEEGISWFKGENFSNKAVELYAMECKFKYHLKGTHFIHLLTARVHYLDPSISDRTANPQITITMRQILANQQLLGNAMSFTFFFSPALKMFPFLSPFTHTPLRGYSYILNHLSHFRLEHQVPQWVLIKI